ncbi:hypothetical protein JMG10_39995 [Nostoc ellipsosporum NOK]|nr:hypothetical protein [Nostoc ellipsosporum NOK]BAZ52414.1 hypothetical protein NIES4103_50750 [Nostoc sp. NIES-4103]
MIIAFLRNTATIVATCSFALVSMQPTIAQTATFTIDASKPQYSGVPAAQGIGVTDIVEVRIAGMTSLVGRENSIRLANGQTLIQRDDVVSFKWQDGSSEKGKIVSLFSTVGTTPIPGTQQPALNSGGSGGGGGYFESDGGEYGSNNPYENCHSIARTVTITVGEGENSYSETYTAGTNLECPGGF